MVNRDHHTGDELRAELSLRLIKVAYAYACQKVGSGSGFLPPGGICGPAASKVMDNAAISHAACTEDLPSATLAAVRQFHGFIRKNTFLEGSVSPEGREKACFDKFIKAQTWNRITAKRLNYYFRHPSRMPPLVAEILGSAQMDLFRLLGPSPTDEDWKRFVNAKVFSNGTVQGLQPYRRPKDGQKTRFKDTTAYGKLATDTIVTTTRECLTSLGHVLCNGEFGRNLLSGHQSGELVDGSVGASVPKDALVDRFIAIEPMLNGMAQQGVRAMFAPYLAQWGITLEDQTRNRELARKASLHGCQPGGWSTIDLSSASDTITEPLVRYLLPKGWFELLNAARTSSVCIEGRRVEGYASYCTMGNAFTFPLQCLIFACITRACIRASHCDVRSYRVYGDDIIIPSSASLILIEALRWVGFLPNTSKSFITGFFRESCGGDYLRGDDVSVVILDKDIMLRTTRHNVFNLLQRRNPEHPALWTLYAMERKPLIGPAIDRDGSSIGYFECPEFAIAPRRKWYCKKLQAIHMQIPCLVPTSIKVRRKDGPRAYLAALLGTAEDISLKEETRPRKKPKQLDRSHDLRGSQRYHVRDVRITYTYRLSAYSSLWYALY